MSRPDLTPAAHPEAEAWLPTQQVAGPPTQLFTARERDDADTGVGRRVDERLWELFVVFEPAQALQQQFDRRPEGFIALHDVGAPVSRRWLAALAAARGLALQRLVIRSQGHGVALATIEFAELPGADGTPVRVYSTDVDADSRQRPQIARALLGSSRLGVVLLGDLPPHALTATLQPLHDAIVAGPWRNRELLVLPLAGSSAQAQQVAQLGHGTGVRTTVAPLVGGADQALGYAVLAWNRLHLPLGGRAAPQIVLPAPSVRPVTAPASAPAPLPAAPSSAPVPSFVAPAAPAAPARPRPATLPLQPMPDPRGGATRGDASPMQRYVQRCLEVKGMVSCCVFEPESQRTLAFAGARPGPAALASQGAALYAALRGGAHALGLGSAPPEAAVTLAGHHLVLRPVPGHPGLVLHAVIDRSATPLVLAMRHLERLDEALPPR
ncbi:MAG: hypothetical protein ACLGIT_05015 [Gammaproteobacteria bacterium]